MKKLGMGLAVVLMGAAALLGQGAAKPEGKQAEGKSAEVKQTQEKLVEAKPIGVLGWFVGGVWTADMTKLGNGMQRIETRYTWSDNGTYVRFTTHFVFEKRTINRYDGNLYWDPEKKALAMWYMASDGSILQGPMTWQGDVLSAEFRAPDFEDKMADLKVKVTRKTKDKYEWALFEKEGAGWKPLANLEYNRTGA